MSEKSCYNCYAKNTSDDEVCQSCGAPLDLSEYIESKKVDESIIDKIRSLFGKKKNLDGINAEIKEFITTSLIIADYEEDLSNLKSDKISRQEFENKYTKLFKLSDLNYLDIILKDEDLNNKFSSIKRIKFFTDNYPKVEQFNKDLNNLKNSNVFVTFKQKNELLDNYKKLYNTVHDNEDFKEFSETYNDMNSIIESRNDEYVQNELDENKEFFDDIDGKSLDKNQRLAVVRNEQNSQIIAGAGCGKTLTVNAKVRYLTEKKAVNPSDILCLSFSTLSVADLKASLPEGVEISTFHSLGSSILKANNCPSRVEEYALTNFVKDFFKNNVINNKQLCEDIVEYYSYYLYSPIAEDDADSLGEVYDLEASRDFRTLRDLYGGDKQKFTYDNKIVKSFEELLIANYLFAHKIDYEYEKVYESDNKYYSSQKDFIFNLIFENISEITDYPTLMDELIEDVFTLCEIEKHVKMNNYVPDFYLKDYDIYLEHFGVNRNCDARWLDEEASEKYKDGIIWKRRIHRRYGSTLAETYSYYMSEGRLLLRLEEKLKDLGVEITEIDYEWLFSKIIERDDVNKFNNFIKLLTEFIELFKGNDYAIGKFEEFKSENEKNEDEFDKKRTALFLNIAETIFKEYEEYLREISKIDFNDMINHATREVRKGNLHKTFRYIIVDEYQDTSYTRYNLVKAIQDKTGAKVCVVGDDWQSIYRFTGCDVSLFSKFENYFENPDILTIETTYRNSQELIDISGRFIKKNPNQIDKSLKSKKAPASKPVKLIYYNNHNDKDKIKKMEMLINEIAKHSTDIMILGRNNFDIDDFVDEGLFKRKNNDDTTLIYEKNMSLNIDFISVHKSKGLECDNVILINLENNIVGFPNQIVDDPLLNFVINDSDQYPYGEERRLFYVALTRTKNNVYLLVPTYDKSEFVVELEEHIDDLDVILKDTKQSEEEYDDIDEFMKDKRVFSVPTKLKCPVCKTGDVILKIIKSKSGDDIFNLFECSHRRCDWNGGYYYSHLDLLDETEICPQCGKVRYIANGRYGPYLRCSKGCKRPKITDKQLKKAKKVFNSDDDYEHLESKLDCPKCGKGKVTLKINQKTKKQQFVCSNDSCDYDGGVTKITESNLSNIKECPKCGGVLILRNGRYGEFLSCNMPNCKYTESVKQDNPKTDDFEDFETDLKCPECGKGIVVIRKDKKSKNGSVICSKCSWNGGSFDKSGKVDSVEYCKNQQCTGITYLRNGRFGEFRACSNYFKSGCNGKAKKKSMKYSKSRNDEKQKSNSKNSKKSESSSNWDRIKIDLKCPECRDGDVILIKNKENNKGFFACTNDDCNWHGGQFNKSEDVLDTLNYCPNPNCDGLTYETVGKYGPFRACTRFSKTGCKAGRK